MKILKKIQQFKLHRKGHTKSTTNSFHDERLRLDWKSVNKANFEDFPDEFNSLNAWSSDSNIQRFIARKLPLDILFKSAIPEQNETRTGLYFAYENNQFVGLILISTIPYQSNQTSIDYIIVNPQLTRQGYATRMINSFQNNLEFFCHGTRNNSITASIESENISSRKAFEKNAFQPISGNRSSGCNYLVYYFKPHNKSTSQELNH